MERQAAAVLLATVTQGNRSMRFKRCSSSNHGELRQRPRQSRPHETQTAPRYSCPRSRGPRRQLAGRQWCSGSYSNGRSGSLPSAGGRSSTNRRHGRGHRRDGSGRPDQGERGEGCERRRRRDRSDGSGGDVGRYRRRSGRSENHSWMRQSRPEESG